MLTLLLLCRCPGDYTVRIEFQERGTHALRGVPGDWKLFAATEAAG
jgi:hypothetical protein